MGSELSPSLMSVGSASGRMGTRSDMEQMSPERLTLSENVMKIWGCRQEVMLVKRGTSSPASLSVSVCCG